MLPATVLLAGWLLADCLAHEHQVPFRYQDGPFIAAPTRPLVWGDINIIHTTDTHGWLSGHLKDTAPEPNYSGDIGMLSSFVSHLKAEAEERNVDLLMVDSGDLHDGNGLTDGFPVGGIDGHEALKLFRRLPYDVMAIGNHELYKYEVAYDMYKNFAPKLHGRYLTSNVNITVEESGQLINVPIGDRFSKFQTRLGRNITAFGVLFDFQLNSINTTIQSPADMVQESWFKDAIAEEPDLFLLVGHMAIQPGSRWPVVFEAIRAVHPLTPIAIFGGHTHIRDCVQLDSRSMSLESGQFMETLGWMSLKFESDQVAFTRRYLDANMVTYAYHTGKHGEDFHTKEGKDITTGIQTLSNAFNLSYQFGIAPQDYFKQRVPTSSSSSVINLFASQVLPTTLKLSSTRGDIPAMFVANSGVLRYDVFKGSFTRNDQYIVSPFQNTFEYVQNISRSVAAQVVDELNRSGLPSLEKLYSENTSIDQADPFEVYSRWLQGQWERWNSEPSSSTENLTLGYVTTDACPGAGDDVPHQPVPHYPLPPFIGSDLPNTDYMDLVFVSFIRDSVLIVINEINAGNVPNVTDADVKPYTQLAVDNVFGLYASMVWS
ncbi:hypothetical protein M422DRAFT_35441 [Sphaerobolus stellatus SS14]|uniref:Calcineurin-like phosphoesterase domain-containing protein n=1 Tax=Sphaerobolus stellatus (strain SS14) TaxID=990650 RepID=A0A0C9UWA0_SPHS4|nr:hypothetical protein M422DRAFT_35441 [Sphaerobolus stellatus SS14]